MNGHRPWTGAPKIERTKVNLQQLHVDVAEVAYASQKKKRLLMVIFRKAGRHDR
jgi:hypothetical protein